MPQQQQSEDTAAAAAAGAPGGGGQAELLPAGSGDDEASREMAVMTALAAAGVANSGSSYDCGLKRHIAKS
jgi:hypothetical protein